MNTREERSVDLSIEVEATPEEVWEAISTGPGISRWFVPTDIEGDAIHLHHENGLEQTGTIVARDRPRHFGFEFPAYAPTPEAEPQRTALEIFVEAQAGGTCVIRLVNSGFGTGADWDRQLERSEAGWERCLARLREILSA
jgi:uncharacterized protein YndB with AHSA1/START domain